MATSLPHPRGSKWESFRRLVFATYGDVCIVCGHGGARTVDHLQSLTEHPELAWDIRNCRPVHALPYNRCKQCQGNGNCNGIKGGYSLERARRRVAEINGRPAETPPELPPPLAGPGRDW